MFPDGARVVEENRGVKEPAESSSVWRTVAVVSVSVPPFQGLDHLWESCLGLQPRLSLCGPSALEVVGVTQFVSKGTKARNDMAWAEVRRRPGELVRQERLRPCKAGHGVKTRCSD